MKEGLSSGAGGTPFVFGNSSWIPLAGHWFKSALQITATPVATRTPTSTPVSCSVVLTESRYLRSRPKVNSSFAYMQIPANATITASSVYDNPNYVGSAVSSSDATEVWISANYQNYSGWLLAAYNYNSTQPVHYSVDSNSFNCIINLLPQHVFQYNADPSWKQKAQLASIVNNSTDQIYPYLYQEGQSDSALLLAQLAITESNVGLPLNEYYGKSLDVAWTIRMRAFIGLINYSGQQMVVPGLPTKQATGQSGNSVSIADDLIYGKSNYTPITVFAEGHSISNNESYGFNPVSDFDLEDLYVVYQSIKSMLSSNWQNSPVSNYEHYYGPAGAGKFIRDPFQGYPMTAPANPNPPINDASTGIQFKETSTTIKMS